MLTGTNEMTSLQDKPHQGTPLSVYKLVSQIQSLYIGAREKTDIDILSAIIPQIVLATGSESGLLGEAVYSPGSLPSLIASVFMSSEYSNDLNPDKLKGRILEAHGLDNILGDILISKTSVVTKDAIHLPRLGKWPKTHPPIKSMMAVPLVWEEDKPSIGILLLGNHPTGYDEQSLIYIQPLTFQLAHIFYDIQERRVKKKLESEKLRLEKEEAVRKNQKNFVARVSHELRTPLQTIVGTLELLSSDAEFQLEERCKKEINSALNAAHAMTDIIEDLLDISRINQSKIKLISERFSPRELIVEVVDVFRHKAEDNNVILKTEIHSSLPEILLGDKPRVRQVLLNLVSNAVKFTEKGYVTVNLSGSFDADKRKYVLRGEVEDTGIGIAPEFIPSLFTPFVQADTSSTRKYGGTGLGLAISKSLCHLMGGDLGILKSIPGQGSIFWFAVNTEVVDNPSIHIPSSSVMANYKIPSELSILVAEDNIVNQKLLKHMLQRIGASHVDVVEDGVAAVAAVQSKKYDVVFLDCCMPKMDGKSACKYIRNLPPPINNIAIIVLTADATADSEQKYLQAGMDYYLAKPVTINMLGKAIQDVLLLKCGKN